MGKRFGLTMDGKFLGRKGCSFDLNLGIVPQVNFAVVDHLNIQAQPLLQASCGDNVLTYAQFVAEIIAVARHENPHIVISAQVSLRYSSVAQILEVIDELRGVVDAIYLADPVGVSGITCPNCTTANVDAILSHL
jgi:hypothetical protein